MSDEKFTSETLQDGLVMSAHGKDGHMYRLTFGEQSVLATKEEIARMYGIAFPAKKHGCCKINSSSKCGPDGL